MYHFVSAYLCLQRMSEGGLEGKNPTKWHWEKGSWRWGLAKIEALQNGSGIFICFIRSWMHWFDHFLTKLSKYLWIKTGDRHYHFVEPWVIDRPFCRMETVPEPFCRERGWFTTKWGTPTPPREWQHGSPKRRVRSQLASWEMKNCTPLWREAHLQVKIYKTPQRRTAFGSCDVEIMHAVVARSTFASENVQNTPLSDHFWKLRCRKSARRCCAKHISKWKCTKHTSSGS